MKFLIAGVLFLSACATAIPRTEEFQEDDLRPYAAQGTAAVSGKVLIRNVGLFENETHIGSEVKVQLTPVSSFTTEWYREGFLNDRKLDPDEPRLEQYVRQVRTDEQGNFEFRDLPPGDYYLTSEYLYSTRNVWAVEGWDEVFEDARVSTRIRISDGEQLSGIELTAVGPDTTESAVAAADE